jgi:hypothetical protein
MIVRLSLFGLIVLQCGLSAEHYDYASLDALMSDLRYNEARREQIVHPKLDDATPVVTIQSVLVQSVDKDANGTGFIVMTYGGLKRPIMFGAVYHGDLKPAMKLEDLRHDDRVTIIGSVFAYDPAWTNGNPAEGVRIFGLVMPAKKAEPKTTPKR